MTTEEDEGHENSVVKMEGFPHLVHYRVPAKGASRRKNWPTCIINTCSA